jgi:hypothetical protein
MVERQVKVLMKKLCYFLSLSQQAVSADDSKFRCWNIFPKNRRNWTLGSGQADVLGGFAS